MPRAEKGPGGCMSGLPSIRIELDDGTGTYVNIYYIKRADQVSVFTAAEEAYRSFVRNLAVEWDTVERNIEMALL